MANEQRYNNNWYPFDAGMSIGQSGSESGKIIEDIENINGARITIEKGASNAPFAVTLGVYGLLFHTYYSGMETQARLFANESKNRIEKLLEHISISQDQQDNLWKEIYNKLVEQICAQE
jgi:hypothetical protein